MRSTRERFMIIVWIWAALSAIYTFLALWHAPSPSMAYSFGLFFGTLALIALAAVAVQYVLLGYLSPFKLLRKR